MLKLVPTVKTTFDIKDFIKSMAVAWKNIYGKYPEKKNLATIYSQYGIETGGGEACWCYNIGNIKASDVSNEVIDYCALVGVWEIVNGKKIEVPPTSSSAWFRAFDNLDDGVLFYFNFLKNDRYKSSWVAVEKGDYVEFSQLLHDHGYYTDTVSNYTKGMSGYYNNFMNGKTFDLVMTELNAPSTTSSVPTVAATTSNIVDPFDTPDTPALPIDVVAAATIVTIPKQVQQTQTTMQKFMNVLMSVLRIIFHVR